MSKYQAHEFSGWWSRDVNPNLSLVILIIATLVIFGIGALFVREYIGIWTEVGQLEKNVIYFPEKPGILEKIILP